MKRDPAYCPPFTPMWTVLEEGSCDGWELVYEHVTREKIEYARTMDIYNHRREHFDLEAGAYVQLRQPTGYDRLVMSDTPSERRTNMEFIEKARGRVLIGGLGIGMVLLPLLEKKDVGDIVVIEKNEPVVELVWHQILRRLKRSQRQRLSIIQCDLFDFGAGEKPIPVYRYDTIYFDIWNAPDNYAYDDTKRLWRLFRGLLAKNGWMSAWRRDEMRRCALG